MGVALTGGEALYGQGFTQLACLDVTGGHPGVRKVASFHPSEGQMRLRYGGINIFDPIEYLPEQNAGAHAAGLNSQAPALLPAVMERLGTPIAANPQRDALDLSLLVGATQWVIQKAIEFKLLEPAAPPVPPPSPPVVPPAHPPAPGAGLHPLSPSHQRADELRAIFAQMVAMKMLPIPDRFYNLAQVMVADRILFWPALQSIVAELIDSYRRARRSLGLDSREIPAEDR